MLKALELIGFKSFADRTRFEFPPGISVIVGPNGSGKSNIVDALKWVLGEQSAKSLRGKDMADVIFKGSGGPEGRKAMNTAEVTLIIDNSEGKIALDAPEVHVTRRVYRSGEGEYLINNQPCRLKDIKDLFRGTGVGTDAYSLIEQGKVEKILQASPKDRRAIFEEAAGISRFKAKKIESERRLERVEQNMLRLTDIVDEVESRVRSLRAQASKARRYKEHRDRLQDLRTQVGMSDWRKLSSKLGETEVTLQGLNDQIAEATTQIDSHEAQVSKLDSDIAKSADALRAIEREGASNREQIAGHETTIRHERLRCGDLEKEALRLRQQIVAMNSRAGDIQERVREAKTEFQAANQEFDAIAEQVGMHQKEIDVVTRRLNLLQNENASRRDQHVEQMRQVSAASNRIATCRSDATAAEAMANRCRARLGELDEQLSAQTIELKNARDEEETLAEKTATCKSALDAANAQLAESRRRLTQSREAISQLQNEFSGSSQRAQVLEDLGKKLEGVSAGAKDILVRAKQQPDGPYSDVRGMVADLMQVDVQWAPLIDIALGEVAHHVVVGGQALVEHLLASTSNLSGRVGILPVNAGPIINGVDLSNRDGVIQRADLVVEVSPEFRGLIRRLLGRTWLVESLEVALELRLNGPGLRFVTRSGEFVDADGSIVLGPLHRSVGLVSRRSELRALQDELARLTGQIDKAKEEVRGHQQANEEQEQLVQELGDELDQTAAELTEARVRTKTAQQEQQQSERQKETLQAEQRAAQIQQATAKNELAAAEKQLSRLEHILKQLDDDIESADRQIKRLGGAQQQHERESTAAKVELAKSEQRLESLQSQLTQFEEVQRERTTAISEVREQLAHCGTRFQQSQREILRATSELAGLYVRKEACASTTKAQIESSNRLTAERSHLRDAIQTHRKLQHSLEEQLHQAEMAAGEIRHQRETLAQRMREDYGIELAEVTDEPSEDQQREREEVDAEIDDLRRKVNNIGSVNMEALEELEDLETRYESLAGQHNDLTEAKAAIERIIQKINADSRRLFTETMEAIRINFQALFRKAFGGGRADIMLEEGADEILEAGIDIVANPPGKPQFSNSLLSGGEKALTAVALLLAVFQFRPSPFCVLDEVDAPFDEANIGRFIDVLNEFLGWTRFVIVTHSKKTMTSATTLYGVTMQESGVSKRVSVRFEDVSEDGQISSEALNRGDDDADAA